MNKLIGLIIAIARFVSIAAQFTLYSIILFFANSSRSFDLTIYRSLQHGNDDD